MTASSFASNDRDEFVQAILTAIQQLNDELSELRQYIGADFEVVNLRFDRIEDRMDRLESNLIYEH